MFQRHLSVFTPVPGSGESVLLVRDATRSEISLAVAMRRTRDHEDVDKDEANLQVQKTVMPLRLRLFVNS